MKPKKGNCRPDTDPASCRQPAPLAAHGGKPTYLDIALGIESTSNDIDRRHRTAGFKREARLTDRPEGCRAHFAPLLQCEITSVTTESRTELGAQFGTVSRSFSERFGWTSSSRLFATGLPWPLLCAAGVARPMLVLDPRLKRRQSIHRGDSRMRILIRTHDGSHG